MSLSPEIRGKYQPVIGLEIHIQLDTHTKVFAGDPRESGASPNQHVSAVTYAHPGALPYPNVACIDHMVTLGVATDCEIVDQAYFARKNYFYPDLPKGYQISQDQLPLCKNGKLTFPLADGRMHQIRIERIHLEEDAGKSIHDQHPTRTLIDLNRAGTGLAELVTHPDLRSPEEAGAFVAEIRRLVRYIGVSDANMEAGNLRCDANVSVMPKGSKVLGTRVEIKNLNSISYLMKAVTYEIDRQIGVIEGGGSIQQQTRLWDVNAQRTAPMRDKETAQDYRYFPEPDMLPIQVLEETVQERKQNLPARPAHRFEQYVSEDGIGVNEALVLIEDRAFSDYYESLRNVVGKGKPAANWLLGPVRAILNESGTGIRDFSLTPESLGSLIALVAGKKVSHAAAKDQLLSALVAAPDKEVASLAKDLGLIMESNADGIVDAMQALMERSPNEVSRYRKGKKNLLGFFVGQLMREFKGKANPQEVNKVVREMLDKAE